MSLLSRQSRADFIYGTKYSRAKWYPGDNREDGRRNSSREIPGDSSRAA